MSSRTRNGGRIVVIGAGLAGLAAAWKLAEAFGRRVLLLERETFTGGMSHTFSEGDISYDFGSHRIHLSSAPEVMGLIRELVGNDLILHERRGRLRLNGKYMSYPPDLTGFLKGLGITTALRAGASLLSARLRPQRNDGLTPSYEECMIRKAGKVIYDLLYCPYAWKVYGADPKAISAHAATTRASLKRPLALARDMVVPRKADRKLYYYPSRGIGTIARELQRRYVDCGGELLTAASPRAVHTASECVRELSFRRGDGAFSVPVDVLISTIPLNELVELLVPCPSPEVAAGARALQWRAIRFLYLYLTVNRDFSCESEIQYYPETKYIFGRISEPKRFSPRMIRVKGKTLLCVEVLCNVGDRFWRMKDADLFRHIQDDLKQLQLLGSRGEICGIFSRRLPAVYPVYDLAWEENFRTIHRSLNGIRNLYLIGRGGLFLHDNMDHAIQMGLKVAEFVLGNREKTDAWAAALSTFRRFEVRD